MSQYKGNNTNDEFLPTYKVNGQGTPVNVNSVPMEINGKLIPGYQSTYADGTSKWTAQVHTDNLWDRDSVDNSTFTGSYNETSKKWEWKQSSYPRDTSIQNLWKDARVQVVDDEGNVKQERIGKNWSEIKSKFNNDKSITKNLTHNQFEAVKAEKGLENMKEDDELSKMGGTNTANEKKVISFEDASQAADISNEIKATKTRTKYGNYYYPEDIASNKQDRIIFTMKQSTGRKIDPKAYISSNTKAFQRKSAALQGSVTLPITTGIKDQNMVDWQGSTMNAAQAFGAATAINAFNAAGEGGFGAAIDSLGESAKAGMEAAQKDKNIARAISIRIAQEAVGTQNLLSRAAGAIANPNMELLFNAPGLRSFEFAFQMSPRDKKEASQIKNIINFFKQGMSVKTTSTNVFLKAPNYFDIDYVTFDNNGKMKKHPSINIIKQCALLNCSVDYTPNNTYMTYSDETRSMVSYTMTLQFNELDPIYEEDYYEGLGMQNNTNVQEIGF